MQSLFAGSGRPGGRPTFSIGPIPVKVELSFWLITALLGMHGDGAQVATWVAVVFVSILFHELGHAAAYRLRGARAEIMLYGGGGLTFGLRERAFGMGERIFTALAGPFAGMLLGGLVYLFQQQHGPFDSPLATTAVRQLLFVNIGWGFFNLLPVLPLDGGHVLEALLVLRNEERGRVWARYVSIALCAVLVPLAYIYVDPWPAMMLALFAIQSFQTLAMVDPSRQPKPQQAIPVDAPPPEAPDVIDNLSRLHKLLADEQPEQARAVAHQVLASARGVGARDQALRALAWLAIGDGDGHAALGFLAKTSPRFDDPLTWGTAIAASGDALTALPHLARAFQRSPDAQTVATYARCLAAVGRRDEARKLAGPDAPIPVQRALGEALFRSHDFPGSAEISRRLFERGSEPLDAYNLACAESRMGHPDDALRWLRTAVDSGFTDRAHIEEDPDLEPLRAHGEWAEILSRVPSAG